MADEDSKFVDFDEIIDVLRLFPLFCIRKITKNKENRDYTKIIFKSRSKDEYIEYLSGFRWTESEYIDLKKSYIAYNKKKEGVSQYIASINSETILNPKDVITRISNNQVRFSTLDGKNTVTRKGFLISNDIISKYKDFTPKKMKENPEEIEPFKIDYWDLRKKIDVLPDFEVSKLKYNVSATIKFDLKNNRIFFYSRDYSLINSARSAVVTQLSIPLADHVLSTVGPEQAKQMFDSFINKLDPNKNPKMDQPAEDSI